MSLTIARERYPSKMWRGKSRLIGQDEPLYSPMMLMFYSNTLIILLKMKEDKNIMIILKCVHYVLLVYYIEIINIIILSHYCKRYICLHYYIHY